VDRDQHLIVATAGGNTHREKQPFQFEEEQRKMEIIAKINRKKRTIAITMPLQKATPSKSSGKTLVVASTHGCQTTEARHSGRPIVVTANAFIYAASRSKGKRQRVDRQSGSVRADEAPTGTSVSDRSKS
jgi:hypothetical protein